VEGPLAVILRLLFSHYCTREVLQIPEQDQQYDFESILTGDESWSFLTVVIICAGPQIQMTRLKFRSKKTQSEKCVISIIWGSTGVKSLLYVLEGMKYNATFFVESAVPDLVERVCEESRRKALRGMMVHLDNAQLHNCTTAQQQKK
jgi:hypothetical protein